MQRLIQLFRPSPPPSAGESLNSSQSWGLFEEGQLLVDMYERADAVVLRALVAGANPDELEISMYNDLLTIRGSRAEHEEIHDDRYFHRECYWGTFSRSVVIPVPVDADSIRAYFKNGVVTIELPKIIDEQPSILLERITETEP